LKTPQYLFAMTNNQLFPNTFGCNYLHGGFLKRFSIFADIQTRFELLISC